MSPRWWSRRSQPPSPHNDQQLNSNLWTETVLEELCSPFKNFSNTGKQKLESNCIRWKRKTGSLAYIISSLKQALFNAKGNSPATKSCSQQERESRVNNQVLQPFRAPHKGPASISPHPETNQPQMYRILGIRKKNRGYWYQPHSGSYLCSQWPALQTIPAAFTREETHFPADFTSLCPAGTCLCCCHLPQSLLLPHSQTRTLTGSQPRPLQLCHC